MSTLRETLTTLAQRWMALGWQQPTLAEFRKLHAADFRDRSAAGRATDLGAFVRGIEDLYAAFPSFFAQTESLVVDAEQGLIAIRWSARGTHRGTFLQVPPTEREITFTGIEILRVEEGLIAERWGEWNGLEIYAQLTDES